MTFVIRCPLFSDWKRAQIERVEEWESVGAFDAVYVPLYTSFSQYPSKFRHDGDVHLREHIMRCSRAGPRNTVARQKVVRIDAL